MSQLTIAGEGLYVKDPNATEIIEIDWDAVLPTGALIISAVSTVSLVRYSGDALADAAALAALLCTNDVVDAGGRATQMNLAGGTLGATYLLTNRATMQDGQIKDQSFSVLVEDK